jgi:hypothetical protein
VDDLSSAHVYLRQKEGEKLDDISPTLLHECGQLVKANSIEGSKLKSVYVVYTRWRNLKKTSAMEVGAIGYHDKSKQRRMLVEKDKQTVNDLNRTKVEVFPDLYAEQQQRASDWRSKQKDEKRDRLAAEKAEFKKRLVEEELRSYKSLQAIQGESNKSVAASVDQSAAEEWEDDFM